MQSFFKSYSNILYREVLQNNSIVCCDEYIYNISAVRLWAWWWICFFYTINKTHSNYIHNPYDKGEKSTGNNNKTKTLLIF